MAWPTFTPAAPPPPPACTLPATSLAAGLLALLAVRLAVAIIRVRRGSNIPYQSDDKVFLKRQRALANLCECVLCVCGGGWGWGVSVGGGVSGGGRGVTLDGTHTACARFFFFLPR